MTLRKSSPNNSLLKRGNIWHIHWNVPKGLRSNPLFRNKAIYSKTLQTTDVHEARKMRDRLVSQFRQMVEVSAAAESRRAFQAHYAEAMKAQAELTARLAYMDEADPEAMFNVVSDYHDAYCAVTAASQGNIPQADAYLAAMHGRQEAAEKYAMTLKEVASAFIQEHEGEVNSSTLSKVKIASASLLKSIGNKDTKLKDVNSRQVTRWIKAIAKDSSDSTRSGYLSALHKMWHWAWEHEHVDGVSPFKGIKMARQGDEASYQDFTVAEVQSIIKHAGLAELELMRFGLVTGCRISELVGLTAANFTTIEGVHAVQIFEGKTDAASRIIPLPVPLWGALKQCVAAGMWAKKPPAQWSHRFGAIKLKATGKRDRTKAYHSFRHMTATAYEREHIEERIVSVLLGHKNKRGESMSYGLYSAGLAPKQYLEAVEKMLAGEYMQSFLKLFPQ